MTIIVSQRDRGLGRLSFRLRLSTHGTINSLALGYFTIIAYHVPLFVAIECPLLPDLVNGVITYMEDMTPNFELTTMAIHECNEPGYTRVGPRIRTCVRSSDPNSLIGVWDQTAPTCVRKSGKFISVYKVLRVLLVIQGKPLPLTDASILIERM